MLTEHDISGLVVEKSLEVHRNLGPGLLESVYEKSLLFELRESGLHVTHQHPLPVVYKDIRMELGFRLDLWVENKVIIEVKSVEALNDVHLAQVLTYLKLTENKLGF